MSNLEIGPCITMTKGLPASGKTSWARRRLEVFKGKMKIVNKDLLREMLDGGTWSKGNEKVIVKTRNTLVRAMISDGYHVIVDDTNLAPAHEQALRQIAEELEVPFYIHDLTDVSITECLKRDAKRANPVGPEVIKRMYNQFLIKPVVPVKYDMALPQVILCDLDGTLAIHNGRSPYAAAECGTDLLNTNLAGMLQRFRSQGVEVIFFTGREDTHRVPTQEWLNLHQFGGCKLFMRKGGDVRKDFIVKEEMYRNHIEGDYNVEAIFDDRAQVCRMWHRLGLPLLRVGDPDAEF